MTTCFRRFKEHQAVALQAPVVSCCVVNTHVDWMFAKTLTADVLVDTGTILTTTVDIVVGEADGLAIRSSSSTTILASFAGRFFAFATSLAFSTFATWFAFLGSPRVVVAREGSTRRAAQSRDGHRSSEEPFLAN